MKDKIKYTIFAALALIVIGCCIVGIGRSLGGSMIWSFKESSGQKSTSSDVHIITSSDKIVIGTISLDPFDTIEIKNISVNCFIEKGDAFKLEYAVVEGKEPKYEQKGSSLIINEPSVTIMGSFLVSDENNYYKLTIPDNTEIKAKVKNTSGDVYVSALMLSGNVSTVSGYICLSELTGNDLNVTSTSGDLSFGTCTFDTLSVSTVSGCLTSSHLITDKLKAGSTSGDIFVTESNIEVIELNSVSGCAQIESTELGDFSAGTTSGDITLSPYSINEIDCNTTSGVVCLVLPGEEDDYRFDISCTSGDIQIDTYDYEHKYRSKNSGKDIDVHTTSGDVNVYFK